jgi:hypothetical protein
VQGNERKKWNEKGNKKNGNRLTWWLIIHFKDQITGVVAWLCVLKGKKNSLSHQEMQGGSNGADASSGAGNYQFSPCVCSLFPCSCSPFNMTRAPPPFPISHRAERKPVSTKCS